MQRQIREKTWGKNVGAELRIMGTNGYVRSSQVRDMVKRLRIDLTPEETTFLAGAELGAPDDFVPVLVLTRALEVPYFDEYDPLHGAREREKGLLGRGITAPRGPTGPRGITRGHLWLGTADVPELFARDPLVPGSAGARAPRKKMDKDGSEAGEEKRQMNELSKQMRNKGMTMLQFFRSIDKDSSGIIDRPEFQQAIQTEEMRSVRAQLDTLWGAIDKDDSGTINYIEMIDALREADAMRPQTRPSTMGTPGQGRITEENRQRASASSRNPRSPLGMNGTARERILPKDHFNLRIPHRTGAPYQTATVVVPIKTSFSYCPDYERYTTMTLENNAISDGSGQAVDIVRTRAANKVERRRQAERRIAVAVDEREAKAELSKHRLHWLHMLEAPERGGG